MTAALAEMQAVSRVYSGDVPVTALDSVNLTIRPGEFVAVVGPSGSGKSTLLHILGCLDQPSSGRVILAGHDTAGLKSRQLATLRAAAIGFIFQDFHLIPTKTAAENVALPLLYRRLPRAVMSAQVSTTLDRVGMVQRARHYPSELSGGERQRIAIARALVVRPSLIVGDEPTGNLDTLNSAIVMRSLRALAAEGIAVVVATHDSTVAAVADRTVTVVDGRTVGES